MNLIFFETLGHSSQVTRLQGFEGYMVTELQNPPYILPYLIRIKEAEAPLVEAASIPRSESSCQMSDLEGNANLCFVHSINDDELNVGHDSRRRKYITNMPELASKRNQLETARQGCPI